jgi:hypothetical protein
MKPETITANTYRSSPIKRDRRSKAAIEQLCRQLYLILENDHPMTVRQVFYRMVAAGAIEKTEAEYKTTITRLLGERRLSGNIPFDWLADNTRWMRKPYTHSSLESALYYTAQTYRRSLWDNQDAYVEVWFEKDALAGVLYGETEPWDVPLMVTRGYPSLSFLHTAAEYIGRIQKSAFIYYYGDWDPSGKDISRNVEARLRQFAPTADITFHRVAVNEDQIAALALPTRPTKKADSRSKGFVGESVELDAIPPATLRRMVNKCITGHIDSRALEIQRLAEQEERKALELFAQKGIA